MNIYILLLIGTVFLSGPASILEACARGGSARPGSKAGLHVIEKACIGLQAFPAAWRLFLAD
jgi:hypothetical protein